jgi:hypothetical protein
VTAASTAANPGGQQAMADDGYGTARLASSHGQTTLDDPPNAMDQMLTALGAALHQP